MIPYGRHLIDDESDVEAVSELLRGGMLTKGDDAAFEEAVAATLEQKYAVAVSSATARAASCSDRCRRRRRKSTAHISHTFVAVRTRHIMLAAMPPLLMWTQQP